MEYECTDISGSKTMHTYIITDGTYIKIGKSNDVETRIRALQISSPRRLRLVADIPIDIEKKLHNRYSQFRIVGEWFLLRFDQLLSDKNIKDYLVMDISDSACLGFVNGHSSYCKMSHISGHENMICDCRGTLMARGINNIANIIGYKTVSEMVHALNLPECNMSSKYINIDTETSNGWNNNEWGPICGMCCNGRMRVNIMLSCIAKDILWYKNLMCLEYTDRVSCVVNSIIDKNSSLVCDNCNTTLFLPWHKPSLWNHDISFNACTEMSAYAEKFEINNSRSFCRDNKINEFRNGLMKYKLYALSSENNVFTDPMTLPVMCRLLDYCFSINESTYKFYSDGSCSLYIDVNSAVKYVYCGIFDKKNYFKELNSIGMVSISTMSNGMMKVTFPKYNDWLWMRVQSKRVEVEPIQDNKVSNNTIQRHIDIEVNTSRVKEKLNKQDSSGKKNKKAPELGYDHHQKFFSSELSNVGYVSLSKFKNRLGRKELTIVDEITEIAMQNLELVRVQICDELKKTHNIKEPVGEYVLLPCHNDKS